MTLSQLATIGVVVLLLLALLTIALRRKPVPISPTSPFEARPLFTAAERSFLGVLDRAVAGQLRVFAKVRLIDVLKVRSGTARSEFVRAKNQIVAKHVDFVLCSPDDLRVVAVLELDDSSHDAPRARRRDGLVDEACAAARIPVHRFAARHGYSPHDLRDQLAWLLTAAIGTDAHVGDPGIDEPLPAAPPRAAETPLASTRARPMAPAQDVTCPTCGSEMVERVARRGPRAGTSFLACSAYPHCRTIRDSIPAEEAATEIP
jgi:hypothetical protein